MSEGLLDGYTPADFGLDPNQFPSYRDIQLEAVEYCMQSDSQVNGLVIPGGGGKSLFGWTLHKATGLRTAILTITKGLGEQYKKDFSRYALCEIKGKDNYSCGDYPELSCKGGQTMGCRYVGGGGCEYERVKGEARNRDAVVTNYAFWMNVNDKAQGIERTEKEAEARGENPIELLILDEGHDAPDALADYLHCTLYEKELEKFGGEHPRSDDIHDWQQWMKANMVLIQLEVEIKTTQQELIQLGHKATPQQVKVLHQLEGLFERLMRVEGMQANDWVCDMRVGTKWGRMWAFDVVWPGRYAKQYLFCNVPKVVIMSATLREKTMWLLGLKKEDYGFKEWRRVFPASRNPIYLVPPKKLVAKTRKNPTGITSIRMDRRTEHADQLALIEQMDKWIDARLDRKGLIQSVSYDLQRFIMAHSRHARLMIGNTDDPDSDTAIQAAERFRKMKAPSILISPSFTTGWDFPGIQCEYICFPKMPFIPMQSKVMKARDEKDEEYGNYLTMTKFVQGCLRGMRFEMDQCEVAVFDGHGEWFLSKRNEKLAPVGFINEIRRVPALPKPLPKLIA